MGMQRLLDKAVLLGLCLLLLFSGGRDSLAVTVLLTGVALSALNTYLGLPHARWLSLLYLALCAVWGDFLLLLPLLAYDLAREKGMARPSAVGGAPSAPVWPDAAAPPLWGRRTQRSGPAAGYKDRPGHGKGGPAITGLRTAPRKPPCSWRE